MLTIVYLALSLLTDITDFNLIVAVVLIAIDAIITVMIDV